jgi:hypothetical protein
MYQHTPVDPRVQKLAIHKLDDKQRGALERVMRGHGTLVDRKLLDAAADEQEIPRPFTGEE